jgi:hypothetical protein
MRIPIRVPGGKLSSYQLSILRNIPDLCCKAFGYCGPGGGDAGNGKGKQKWGLSKEGKQQGFGIDRDAAERWRKW